MSELEKYIQDDFAIVDERKEVFSVHRPEDFGALFNDKPIEKLHVVATDSIFQHMREFVNRLSEHDFETLKNFHLATCERADNQFATSHGVWIGRKK